MLYSFSGALDKASREEIGTDQRASLSAEDLHRVPIDGLALRVIKPRERKIAARPQLGQQDQVGLPA